MLTFVNIPRLLLLCAICGLCVLIALSPSVAGQTTQTTWLSPDIPEVKTMETISQSEYGQMEDELPSITKQPCVERKIAIAKISPKYKDGCWYTTTIGLLEKEGQYLLEPGTEIAGRIKGSATYNRYLYPSPNPRVFIETIDAEATGYGFYINFRTLETVKMNREINTRTQSVTLTYQKSGKALTALSPGKYTHIMHSYIWYSSNAKWMLIFTKGGTLIRVNLETFTSVAIHVQNRPGNNWIPGSASITNDGRYAAATIHKPQYHQFYVFDLRSCIPSDDSVIRDSLQNCSKRLLKQSLQDIIPSYETALLPRFYGLHSLEFYHPNSDQTYTRYLMQAPNTQADILNYIALGDSFTSGEGAFDYEPGTDTPENKCHLSRKSYPYLINEQVALHDFHSVACSGARIEDLNQRAQASKPAAHALGEWFPGYKNQLAYIQDAPDTPAIVSVSIGGNNIGFGDKLYQCITRPTNCFNSYEDRQEIIQEINDQLDPLVQLYKDIQQAVKPGATIYVIGYPQIVTPDPQASCALNVRLSQKERELAYDITSYLNDVIQNAAAQAGVSFVDIENSLHGSRLCETPLDTISVHGITAGDDSGIGPLKFIGKESFHPNEKGQELMKQAILNATGGFDTTGTSQSTLSQQSPQPRERVFDALKTNRPLNKLVKNYNTTDVYDHNDTLQETLSGFTYSLAPNTVYRAVLSDADDTEIPIGSYTSNINGDLSIEALIPSNVPSDIYTFHIYGQNDQHEAIDIYRTVQIGSIDEPFENSEDIPNFQYSAPPDSAGAGSLPTHPSLRALLNSTPNISLQSDRATVYLGEQPTSGQLLGRSTTVGVRDDTKRTPAHALAVTTPVQTKHSKAQRTNPTLQQKILLYAVVPGVVAIIIVYLIRQRNI